MYRILLPLCLLLCLGVNADDPAVPSFPPITVAKQDDVAQLELKTTELRLIRSLLSAAQKELPDGYSLRMRFAHRWSNHADHYGMNAYPESMVPLDPDGREEGTEKIYGENGRNVIRTIPWKAGIRDGAEKHFTGTTVTAEIPWVAGEVHGMRRTWHPNGQLHTETPYVKGVAHGISRSYDQAGHLLRTAPMHHGERHGEVIEYWPGTDQAKRRISYRQGVVEGVVIDYYANGQIKRELSFRNNLMHGRERQFEGDGTLTRERWWLDGKESTQEAFNQAN